MSITVGLWANALDYPQGGGNLWVYLNWALGLRALGCHVVWLEFFRHEDCRAVPALSAALRHHLSGFGLDDLLVVTSPSSDSPTRSVITPVEVDLLLDLSYGSPEEQAAVARLCRCRRSALVDIDPGLLQVWVSRGQITLAPRDLYFTIGETVGRPTAAFPDCGLSWHYTSPPVFLPEWPLATAAPDAPYTSVAHWWDEWLVVGDEAFDNSKRVSFVDYAELPRKSTVRLELALDLAEDDTEERRALEARGWSIQPAWVVAPTPHAYRSYIQRSRGEFSCAKPSCMRLMNAWISDRTLCYLASGKPAIVQHTGDSSFLPSSEGLFRFRSEAEAVHALTAVEGDYEHHRRLARQLAEEHFDATNVLTRVLERALT